MALGRFPQVCISYGRMWLLIGTVLMLQLTLVPFGYADGSNRQPKSKDLYATSIDDALIAADVEFAVAIFNTNANRPDADEVLSAIAERTGELLHKIEFGDADTCTPLQEIADIKTEQLEQAEFNVWHDLAFLSRVSRTWPVSEDGLNPELLARMIACRNAPENEAYMLDADNIAERSRLRVLENALAWAPDNFRIAVSDAASDNCSAHQSKLHARNDVAEGTGFHSRYAARGLLVATYSAIALSNYGPCPEEQLSDEERVEILERQVELVLQSLYGDQPLMASSLNSWRFANDILHYALVAAYLSGNQDLFAQVYARLSPEPYFDANGDVNTNHPTLFFEGTALTRSGELMLVREALLSSFAATSLPYRDTIYIYEHIPGLEETRLAISFPPEYLARLHAQMAETISTEASLGGRVRRLEDMVRSFNQRLYNIVLGVNLPREEADAMVRDCTTILESFDPSDLNLSCEPIEYVSGDEGPLTRIGIFNVPEPIVADLVAHIESRSGSLRPQTLRPRAFTTLY